MLDPISIGAATLVAKWFLEGFGKEAAGASIAGLKKIYDVVSSKLTGNKESNTVLERLGEKPSSEARALELAEELEQHLKSDPEFKKRLSQALTEAEQSAATASFVTQVMDNAKVGKITNINTVHGGAHF